MKDTPITKQQFDLVRSAVADAARIKDHVRNLAEQLRQVFSKDYPIANWGVRYELDGDQISAALETPFGIARARLVLGVDERGPMGRYLFERRNLAHDDSFVWGHAWSIRIGQYGEISLEGQEGSSVDLDHPYNGENLIAEIALSLLYAIARKF